ncbi:PIG-L family deacetylase [Demetria terragena]|uniref:PIG-L family deacetylase n=1 Tax=Demetria terragena TaxID=63959 RepID=UPI00037B9C75|nr:PIG-L family deacetylase [Demetria terragena]
MAAVHGEDIPLRLLLIHAHPDDESLATGVTMAHHVERGDEVHVLTCTLGQEGEVIPTELKHLELPVGQPRDPDAPDPLGEVRRAELAAAMTAMGVASHRVLGEDGGPWWRDSGMVGTPSAAHPRAFAGADVEAVGAQVRSLIDELAPDAVVTYDLHGGYGHPDHIQTHRVTLAAIRGMAVERRPQVFGVVTPTSWYEQDLAWLRRELTPQRCAEWGVHLPPEDDTHQLSVVPDEAVSHATVAPDAVPRQRAAIAEHRTQVRLIPGAFVLSNDLPTRTAGREAYQLLDPDSGRPQPVTGPITDLWGARE